MITVAVAITVAVVVVVPVIIAMVSVVTGAMHRTAVDDGRFATGEEEGGGQGEDGERELHADGIVLGSTLRASSYSAILVRIRYGGGR